VSVLVYDQTCAAEKRRRRKRGLFPDPDKRVFINPAVCEGCGDCGVKSNCVAVSPLETELGTKRAIDQSACNKDFSCLNGFCPSFVTVHGAKVKQGKGAVLDGGIATMLGSLPEPGLPQLQGPYSMIVTGVGGTGVVTISAVLGQAAHIEGKGFGAIDMTGLAQKGGAVACHMRVARSADEIHAIRVGVANADLIIGGDLVVTASNKILETMRPDHTAVVVSTYEMTTGDFARNAKLTVPGQALRSAITDRVGRGALAMIDAHEAAVKLFGDSIASNMFLLGFAYQKGHVPIGSAAIEQAIALNGAAVDMNRQAFRFGRLAAHDIAAVERLITPAAVAKPEAGDLDSMVEFRATPRLPDEVLPLPSPKIARLPASRRKAPGRSSFRRGARLQLPRSGRVRGRSPVHRRFRKRWRSSSTASSRSSSMAPPLLGWLRGQVTGHPRKIRLGWMMLAACLQAAVLAAPRCSAIRRSAGWSGSSLRITSACSTRWRSGCRRGPIRSRLRWPHCPRTSRVSGM
jgi:indolepyruvate ferredoxin oxidoreductase